jgi:hypothetical protein
LKHSLSSIHQKISIVHNIFDPSIREQTLKMGDDSKEEEPVPGAEDTTAPGAEDTTAPAAEDNAEDTTAASPEKPKMKRGADRQITKDDGEESEDGNEDAVKGPFKKASAEVMQKRRIVKVKRPSASGGGADDAAVPSTGTMIAEDKGATSMPSIPEEKESSSAEAAPQDSNHNEESVVEDSSEAKPSTSSFGAAAKANPFANISFSAGSTGTGGGGGFGAMTKSATPTFGSSAKFGSVGSSGFVFDASKSQAKPASTSSDAAADPSADEITRASPSSLGVFGRGASITGFGAATGTGTPSTITGFGFGNATTSPATGFGGSAPNGEASSSLLAGSGKNTADAESVFPSATADAADPANGEENEKCILQTRVKLFRLVEKKSGSKAAAESSSTDKKDEETTKDDSNTEDKKSEDEAAGDTDKKEEEKKDDITPAVEKEWKEVGTGPVRILKHTSEEAQYRIVQRRETSPGGAGTKLILNVMVSPTETHVERHADKHVRLTTVLAEEVSLAHIHTLTSFYDTVQHDAVYIYISSHIFCFLHCFVFLAVRRNVLERFCFESRPLRKQMN